MLQQTPLATTGELPSDVMSPPLSAVSDVIFVIGKVLKTGIFIVCTI